MYTVRNGKNVSLRRDDRASGQRRFRFGLWSWLSQLWPFGSWDTVDAVAAAQSGRERLEQLSDDALVELVQLRGGRDDRPFAALMTRHQTMVWRVCYGYFRNAEDAEDLAQEVFVKAYRSLSGFEGRSTFKTWVYRIAMNTCQNELRARARRPVVSAVPLETAAEFVPAAQNVEEQSIERSQQAALLSAFEQLRPEEFQILIWKDVEGMQYSEIAESLGIGVSAAKMRVQRARAALQTRFQQIIGTDVAA